VTTHANLDPKTTSQNAAKIKQQEFLRSQQWPPVTDDSRHWWTIIASTRIYSRSIFNWSKLSGAFWQSNL